MSMTSALASMRANINTPGDLFLLARMTMWGAALRVLKYAVPLPALVRMMRSSATRQPTANVGRECEKVAKLARWACRAPQRVRHGGCLERGLVAYRYLSRLNVDPCLMVGVRPEDRRGSRGHAWIEVGGRVIGEAQESIEPFTCIFAFDANGDLLQDEAIAVR